MLDTQTNMPEFDQDIIEIIHALDRTMRQRMDAIRSEMNDLTILQIRALMHIRCHERIAMSDLAHEFGITKASASVLVGRLMRSDWIKRVADVTDKRKVCIQLTKQGAQRLADIVQKKHNATAKILAILSPEERQQLHTILQKIQPTLH